MKLLIAVVLSALIFVSCEDTVSQEKGTVPTEVQIAEAMGISPEIIVGKRKVSENEYHVYWRRYDGINYSPFVMVQLDNGLWIINKPGDNGKIINTDRKN